MLASLWAKVAILAAVFALGFGGGSALFDHLGNVAMADEKQHEHDQETQRLRDVGIKDAATAKREQDAAHENAGLRVQYAAAVAAHAADAATRDDALRSGSIGVRVRTIPGSYHPADVSPGGTAPGADGSSSAQLDPATAADEERITNTGDDAIRQLSALQEWVDRNVRRVNAGEQPEVKP